MPAASRTKTFAATAAEGFVLVDGNSVAFTVEPEVALHIATLLTDAAAQAIDQRAAARYASTSETL